MTISGTVWGKYLDGLRKLNDAAAEQFKKRLESIGYIGGQGFGDLSQFVRQSLIDFAYGLATKYGEGSAALACEMYDALAELSGVYLAAAEPAATATYAEVAKAINGTLKTGNPDIVADSVGRLVKRAGVDTTMKNAIRDGAEWAWVPHGDTCAFCITLASRGWQSASPAALKGGHADHIHANCDCTYAVRFDSKTKIQGYDPDKYLKMYNDAPGATWEDKVNAMRRDFYAQNVDKINAQKRDAYQKKKERESSWAEETDVTT